MILGIVIQARMGSARLPGKVMLPIGGRPLLDHVVGRLSLLNNKAITVVATGTGIQNDVIVEHCRALGVQSFRGSEHDVLDRYVTCAQTYGLDHVVRLTADNPFTDIEELDRLIDLHLHEGNDYTHSFGVMPIGVGAEIFTYSALAKSGREARDANHREHVNEYVQENSHIFRIGHLDVPPEKRRPEISLTVDTKEDYLRACRVADRAGSRWSTTMESIAAC